MGHHFEDFSSCDFDAFEGAEPFPDGRDPFVCYMANGSAVVGARAGFTIINDQQTWFIPVAFASARAARRFGSGLLGDLECSRREVGSNLSAYDAVSLF